MSGIREWVVRRLLPAGFLDAMVERSVDEAVVSWSANRPVVEVWQSDVDAVVVECDGGYWRADGLPVLTDVDLDLARRVTANVQRSLIGLLAVLAEMERAS